MSRIEEIRAMYERERDVAAFRHSMLPIEYCAIGDLLAERDRLAAEVGAARAVADEMHVNMRRIRNERDDLRGALEYVARVAEEIGAPPESPIRGISVVARSALAEELT